MKPQISIVAIQQKHYFSFMDEHVTFVMQRLSPAYFVSASKTRDAHIQVWRAGELISIAQAYVPEKLQPVYVFDYNELDRPKPNEWSEMIFADDFRENDFIYSDVSVTKKMLHEINFILDLNKRIVNTETRLNALWTQTHIGMAPVLNFLGQPIAFEEIEKQTFLVSGM